MLLLPPVLRAYVRLILWVMLIIVSLPGGLLTMLPGAGNWNSLYVQWFMKGTCLLFGIRTKVTGASPSMHGTLFVANHASYIDIIILGGLLPMRFTPKSDIKSWPFFGLLTDLSRPIYINRKQRSALQGHFDEIMQALHDGDNILIFPEGTTSDGNEVMPFKSSMLQLVAGEQAKDVPLQPITLAYTKHNGQAITDGQRDRFAWYWEMSFLPHFWQLLHIRTATVHVHFHEPVHTASFPDRKAITQHCQQVFSRQFDQLTQEAPAREGLSL